MLTKTIPSYLYQQYADDSDLQAFVASFNAMTQEYIDFFNSINLTNYVGNNQISGELLDWVGYGLYGIKRPVLASPHTNINAIANIGTFNSKTFNSVAFNKFSSKTVAPVVYYTVNDDVYKRVITWHFYKGDGKQFNIRWLKRRIQRFIAGSYGGDIQGSYSITVTNQQFGTGNGTQTKFQLTYNFGYGAVPILGGMTSTPRVYKQDWQGNQLQYTTARTNLAPYSGSPQSWQDNGNAILVTANAALAPDGTMTAATIAQTAVLATLRWIGTIVTLTAGITYTASCWLMKVSGTDPQPSVSLGDINFGPTVAEPITGTWQRFSVTFTASSSGTQVMGIVVGWDVNGAPNNNIFAIWGMQVEAASAATSYIPTTTVPVTVTDYSINNTFLVTFSTAPASGTIVDWSGSFTDSVANTSDIGVMFPYEGTAEIRFSGRSVNVQKGTFNTSTFNSRTFNGISFTTSTTASNPMAQVFKAAVQAGVLELPFQYNFLVYV